MVRWSRPRAGGPPAALRRRARSLLGTRELGWLTDRRRSAVVLAGVAALCLVLALVGTGSQEIVAIVGTLALGTLIVALSRGRRLVGSVVVTFLVLCLVGTLAGPRWTPRALDATLRPSTTDTRIGSDAETPPVGTYEVSTTTVSRHRPQIFLSNDRAPRGGGIRGVILGVSALEFGLGVSVA